MTQNQDTPRSKPQIAVALGYEPESEFAPTVLATGRGAVAEQILQIAFAHGVKVREDADLAELLSVLGLESEIPIEAFAAVAEILAYVYRANGELKALRERLAARAQSSPTEPSP